MRTLTRLAPAIGAMAAAMLLMPASPAYAVGCYGSSCNGRDPIAMGCANDVITADDRIIDGIYLELRHSWACGASWARISDADPEDELSVKNSLGRNYGLTLGSGQHSAYTPMVGNLVGQWAQACAKDVGFIDNSGCTDRW